MKKVHFFGSLAGNKMRTGGKTHYERIVDTIEELGYKVITRHSLYKQPEEAMQSSLKQCQEYVDKMKNWLKQADIVAVEVTKPETSTGYEMAIAIQYGKPVIALYTDGQKLPVLTGEKMDKVQHLEYTVHNLKKILAMALDYASYQVDTRFTMVLNTKIKSHLDQIAKSGVNRSEYIRNLIIKDMRKGEKKSKLSRIRY